MTQSRDGSLKIKALREWLNKQHAPLPLDGSPGSEAENKEKALSLSKRTALDILDKNVLQMFLPYLENKSDLLFQEEYEAFFFFAVFIQGVCLSSGTDEPLVTVEEVGLFSQQIAEAKSVNKEDYYHLIHCGQSLIAANAKNKSVEMLPGGDALFANLPKALFEDYDRYMDERNTRKRDVYAFAIKKLLKELREVKDELASYQKYFYARMFFFSIPGVCFLYHLPFVALAIYQGEYWTAFATFFKSAIASVIPGLPAYLLAKHGKTLASRQEAMAAAWNADETSSIKVRILSEDDYQAHRAFRKTIKPKDPLVEKQPSLKRSKAHKHCFSFGNERVLAMDEPQAARFDTYERWRKAKLTSIPTDNTERSDFLRFFKNLSKSKRESKAAVQALFKRYEEEEHLHCAQNDGP